MNLPFLNPQLASSFGRRAFLRHSGLAAFTAALAPVAANVLFNATRAEGAAVTDADVLNFALNLEYLEGEYYTNAVYGKTLADMGVSGSSASNLTLPLTPQVNFTSSIIKGYATEIAEDEMAHIMFLRTALGTAAISEPAIDLQGAFNAAAQAAGINSSFDPYASDGNFVLGAITLTDVGVTAYHGGAQFISDKAILTAAGGILATESYHAATLRTSLYGINYSDPTQFYGQAMNKISDLRDALDGKGDDDQGITNPDGSSNIVPHQRQQHRLRASAPAGAQHRLSGAGRNRRRLLPVGIERHHQVTSQPSLLT